MQKAVPLIDLSVWINWSSSKKIPELLGLLALSQYHWIGLRSLFKLPEVVDVNHNLLVVRNQVTLWNLITLPNVHGLIWRTLDDEHSSRIKLERPLFLLEQILHQKSATYFEGVFWLM